jgi:peptide/nickel transport system permease protein
VVGFLVRRVVFAALTVIATAFFAYGIIRGLRPELYPGEATLGGLWGDVSGALLHLDLGESCMFVGCPPLKRIWLDGLWADLFLLAGGVAVGLVLGALGGLWCAARPRSRASRALESVAMLFYCSPVYVAGYLSLLLFAPPFGLVQLPYFFDPHSYAPPLENPWDFVRSMLLPWLLVGAPLAATLLRLTLALTIDALGDDHVRTARAKGLPHARSCAATPAGAPTSPSPRCSASRRRSWSRTWC